MLRKAKTPTLPVTLVAKMEAGAEAEIARLKAENERLRELYQNAVGNRKRFGWTINHLLECEETLRVAEARVAELEAEPSPSGITDERCESCGVSKQQVLGKHDDLVALVRRAAPFVNAVAAMADDKAPALGWIADAAGLIVRSVDPGERTHTLVPNEHAAGAASDLTAYADLLETEGDGGEQSYARMVIRPRAKALLAAARGGHPVQWPHA